MTTRPSSNLPNEAQAWRRSIEKDIEKALRVARLNTSTIAATTQMQATTARGLAAAGLTTQEQAEAIREASRKPSAPSSPGVASDGFFDAQGFARATVTAGCDEVLLDTKGASIEVEVYELFGRPNVTGEAWRKLAETFVTPVNMTFTPLPAGETWAFKIRAVSTAGVAGEFTAEMPLLLAKDNTAPAKPAAPVGTSRLGQVIISWSGKTATGGSQPVDFSNAELFMSTTALGAGTVVGTLSAVGSDSIVVPEQPYNITRWYWLVAVDYAGNRSLASDRISVATQPLVDTDVIGQVIKGANIVDGSITASDKIIANTITGGLIQALSINAGHLQANAVTADKINAGAVTAVKVAANSITVDKLTVGDFENLAAGSQSADWTLPAGLSWQVFGSFASGWGLWGQASATPPFRTARSPKYQVVGGEEFYCEALFNRSAGTGTTLGTSSLGMQFFDSAGAVVGTPIAASTAAPGVQLLAGTVTAPAGALTGQLFYYLTQAPTPDPSQFAAVGNFVCRRMKEGSLIVNGSITAGKIAADAVTATQISASAITSKHTITGALIRTAASGARTEMNTSGLRVVGSDGNDRVRLGYGIPTGLQVADPNTGNLIPLAPFVFGMKSAQSSTPFNLAWPATDNAYGSTTSVSPGLTVNSPTGRFMSLLSVKALTNSQQDYTVAMGLEFLAGSTVAATTGNAFGQGEYSYAHFGVTQLTPNANYTLRLGFTPKKYYSAIPPATVTGWSLAVWPV
jgi:hypothetical protein